MCNDVENLMDLRADLGVYGVDVKRSRLTAARAEKLVDAH